MADRCSVIIWFPSTYKPILYHDQGVCILQKRYKLSKQNTDL